MVKDSDMFAVFVDFGVLLDFKMQMCTNRGAMIWSGREVY